MAKRRVVQKLEAQTVVTFDEQLWPVNIALMVLGGFAAGTMIALVPRDSPWLWLALGTLCLSVGVLMWVASYLGNHVMRRGVQLAALLSVLFHLLLVIVLYNQDLRSSLLAEREVDIESAEEPPLEVEIEYVTETPTDSPRPDFEQPTEVDTPERTTVQIERRDTPDQPVTRDSTTAEVPQATASVSPSTVRLERTEQAVPRRSDEPSQLSRQVSRNANQPVESVELPQVQPSAEPMVARVEASAQPIERSATAPAARDNPADASPIQPQQQAVQVARRVDQQSPQLSTSQPTLPRAVGQPSAIVGSQAEAPSEAPLAQSSEAAVAPSSSTDVARQENSGAAAAMQQSTESQAASSITQAPLQAANLPRTDAPQIAQSPSAVPQRTAAIPGIPASEAADAPQVAATASATSPSTLAPATSSISRSNSAVPAGAAAPGSADGTESAASSVVASTIDRRTESAQPTLDPSVAATSQPARAVRRADAEASPVAVDSPVAAPAGSAQPEQVAGVEASAGATIQKTDSGGPSGSGAADAGAGSMDVGQTSVSPSAISSRNSGGTGPTVASVGSAPQRSRSAANAPASSLAAQTVADSPAAPAGDGGGAPAAGPIVEAAATVARRGASAAGLPADSAQVAGASVGDATSSTSAGPLNRAEGAASQTGPAVASGVPTLARTTPQWLAADTQAEQIQLPTSPTSGDSPAGAATQLAGNETRSAAGLPGRTEAAQPGAAAGEVVTSTPIVAAPGSGLNPRREDSAVGEGPTVASTAGAGPVRRAAVAGAPVGAAVDIDEPATAAPAAGEVAQDAVQPGARTGDVGRGAGSLPVEITAAGGPGGLGADVSAEVGSLSRRAQRDSQVVHAGTTRFMGRKVGGPVAIDGHARETAEAFAAREGNRTGKGTGPGQPAHRTEASVELGLEYLAREQSPDGSWSLTSRTLTRQQLQQERPAIQSDTAATGLSLLSFLGAGYDHFDEKYQRQVGGGIDWLIKNQKADGDLYIAMDAESNASAKLYSHGIAAIALCEAFGMTGDENLREPAQKAIDYIVATQHGKLGGWRYEPGVESDTSVSGWQLMALKSGELAGLNVPAEAYDKVDAWLDRSQASTSDASQYVYNPLAPNTEARRAGRKPSQAMTAVGLLMRMYLGWNRDDKQMIAGADYLAGRLPNLSTRDENNVDTYYWYYATQVMFHMKGDHWKQWNARLHPLLVDRQVKTGPLAGSWSPQGDRWGDKAGRIYVTTLNLLSLEVNYRHLPIYESTAR